MTEVASADKSIHPLLRDGAVQKCREAVAQLVTFKGDFNSRPSFPTESLPPPRPLAYYGRQSLRAYRRGEDKDEKLLGTAALMFYEEAVKSGIQTMDLRSSRSQGAREVL